MSYLLMYSGLVGALTASFLIVLPTFFVGLNYKTEPISFVTRHKLAGYLFRLGLVTTSSFQICNILGLIIRFKVEYLSFAAVLYLCGSICMALVALISIDANKKVHTLCTKGYFIFSSVGSLLFAYTIWHGYSLPALIALIGGLGTLFLYFRMGVKAYCEYWGILFSILWVLSFYFI